MGANWRLLFCHRALLGVLVACASQAALLSAAFAQVAAGTPTKNPDLSHEDPRIKRVIVRREGDDGAKSYRIPGITVTPRGTIVACFDPTETGQLVIARSTDDGVTWEPPRSITAQIKDKDWRLLFNGPGAGIQLTDGTLVFPAQFKDAKANPSSCFIYSTDQGENWKISPPAIPGTPLTSESQIVQVADGSLLMTMRNETRDPQRAWSRWNWTGELSDGRWVDTRLDVTDPVCMAGLTWHHSGVVLLSNNNSTRRERITIRFSCDEGRTWSAGQLLDPRPSAYSCLATLANGDVGVLYECGDESSVETLTFARFPLEWATEENK